MSLDENLLRYKDINPSDLTPMMQQYMEIKGENMDALLFFRLGDFYELFFDDALEASELLSIALTKRDCGLEDKAPMCGVPYHAVESYIARLVESGKKVAIAEQVEDPKEAVGIVKRQVIRVITPGTVIDPESLDALNYRYIAAIYQEDRYFALAYADVSATRFAACDIIFGNTYQKLAGELNRIQPQEIIVNQEFSKSEACHDYLKLEKPSMSVLADNHFNASNYKLIDHDNEGLYVKALSALLYYLEEKAFALPEQVPRVVPYNIDQYMILDRTARRHLEITETIRERKRQGSLIWAIDNCRTGMGSRKLSTWLTQALTSVPEIKWRQGCIAAFRKSFVLRSELRELLRGIYDLERLSGRLSLRSINPRELYSIAEIQARIPKLQELLFSFEDAELRRLAESFEPLVEETNYILLNLEEELPVRITEGGIFKEGANAELDKYRDAENNGNDWLINFESKEREATGIKNLKLKYNRVFGYTIEVSKSNLSEVPEHYMRRQTLANAERFYTPELKEMEERILGAQQKMLILEQELFVELRETWTKYLPALRKNAELFALIDIFAAQAELSEERNYCCPEVVEQSILKIEQGRHPVVEKMLKSGEFVANDLYLDQADQALMILTGPNMAGKSTYMRQNALIVIMAQAGLYVPADSAVIGICDRIFTRVGASDDLASGQSTFMIEMNEVSQILREAGPRSLLILDEIGRGTSTWDGLSIAWSVIEHISDSNYLACRCLFATHYHELTELAEFLPGVFNAHVDINLRGEDLEFLHQVHPGASDHSYGIEVAKLAEVPDIVINRAREILAMLEEENQGQRLKIRKSQKEMEGQIDLFTAAQDWQNNEELISRIKNLDINLLRPLDALAELADLQDWVKKHYKKP